MGTPNWLDNSTARTLAVACSVNGGKGHHPRQSRILRTTTTMSVRVSWRTHQVPVERKFLPLFVFATTTTMTTTTIRSCVFLICRQFRLTKFIVHFVDLRVDCYGPPSPALSFRPTYRSSFLRLSLRVGVVECMYR